MASAIVAVAAAAVAWEATPVAARAHAGASNQPWSFKGYANDVRVVEPLVGPWQLGYARIHGSGQLCCGSNFTGTIHDSFQPHSSRYQPASLVATVTSYSYHQAAHQTSTTLTLSIQVTSTDAPKCAPGDTGTVRLYESAKKLSNGENSDAISVHWINRRCPTFEQGWNNEDGGRRTSPSHGGPPNGGEWAIVHLP